MIIEPQFPGLDETIRCDECEAEVYAVLEVGEVSAIESATALLCRTCVAAAAAVEWPDDAVVGEPDVVTTHREIMVEFWTWPPGGESRYKVRCWVDVSDTDGQVRQVLIDAWLTDLKHIALRYTRDGGYSLLADALLAQDGVNTVEVTDGCNGVVFSREKR